jgi:hypothetical protein
VAVVEVILLPLVALEDLEVGMDKIIVLQLLQERLVKEMLEVFQPQVLLLAVVVDQEVLDQMEAHLQPKAVMEAMEHHLLLQEPQLYMLVEEEALMEAQDKL